MYLTVSCLPTYSVPDCLVFTNIQCTGLSRVYHHTVYRTVSCLPTYSVPDCLVFTNIQCTWLFVWFDSLRPINNLSVIKGRVFLGWTSTKLGLMFLLKDVPDCLVFTNIQCTWLSRVYQHTVYRTVSCLPTYSVPDCLVFTNIQCTGLSRVNQHTVYLTVSCLPTYSVPDCLVFTTIQCTWQIYLMFSYIQGSQALNLKN